MLALTGTITAQNYQTALESITFNNTTATTAVNRTVSFVITDTTGVSSVVATKVIVANGQSLAAFRAGCPHQHPSRVALLPKRLKVPA